MDIKDSMEVLGAVEKLAINFKTKAVGGLTFGEIVEMGLSGDVRDVIIEAKDFDNIIAEAKDYDLEELEQISEKCRAIVFHLLYGFKNLKEEE